MRDIDYKPQPACHSVQVPKGVLVSTAEYIAAEWEKEMPGCTANDPPEKVQAAILDFMYCQGIQTVEDYEKSLIKEHRTE